MCLKLFYIQLTGDKSELFLQNASPTCDIPFTIDLSGLAKVLLDLCWSPVPRPSSHCRRRAGRGVAPHLPWSWCWQPCSGGAGLQVKIQVKMANLKIL